MVMEEMSILDKYAEQGILIFSMAVLILFLARWIVKENERRNKREEDLETRYGKMVDTVIEQSKSITVALTANTSVMQRVERKLDETPHHPR